MGTLYFYLLLVKFLFKLISDIYALHLRIYLTHIQI